MPDCSGPDLASAGSRGAGGDWRGGGGRGRRGPRVRPLVRRGGGAGGLFSPAEALASELIARGHRIALMADSRSGGLSSAVFAGHECFVIRGAGIAGRGALRGSKAMLSLAAGVAQARRIFTRIEAAA